MRSPLLRWFTVVAVTAGLGGPSLAAGPPPGDTANKPSLTGQTKTRDRDGIKENATESSLLESIDNQKIIIELSDRKEASYPLQVIALADFYWDLAEWYGLQAFSEEIEAPLHAAKEANDERTVAKLAKRQQDYIERQRDFQQRTITAYKEVIRDFPTSTKLDEVRYFLAYNLTEMGQAEAGVDVYTELIGAHPSSPFVPDAIVNIGDFYFERNDFDNALRLYVQLEMFQQAGIYGYAIYKQAWCYYNLGDRFEQDGQIVNGYKLSLSNFIRVIKLAGEQALAGRKGSIALKREAQNDMVLPYSKVGRAGDAIKFLRTYAPERYLSLAGRLASIYTEQNEFRRSTKLLRSLIAEARKGNIAGKDKSYMVVQFQRQIVDNAMKAGDKESTVAEIGELTRTWADVGGGGPKDFLAREEDEIKRLILDVASAYHKEYTQTQERQTLEYTQALYDEYLRVFREDENAYQIAMNNALLLLATDKYEEAAAEFEKVIRMKPDGEFADNAAERAVIAYLKLIQIENKKIKSEATDDLTREDLSSEAQRFINAIDRWMSIVDRVGPNAQTKDNIPTARFAAAKVLYNANHFETSAKRFVDFLDKHPGHSLVNDARRHVLSAYNLAHDVDKLVEYANAFDAIPGLPGDLKKDIATIRNALNFQRCFKYQTAKEHLEAAQCFEQYSKDFPNHERAAAAIYNAGINYFEARQVERALKTQLELYKSYRNNDLAPKALYSMGEMFRQTTVYDEAAKVYEAFVKNHRGHPLEEKALRYASIYRKTLGDYKEAINNLKLWLARFGDQPNAPNVDLDIVKILELQGRPSRVVKAVKAHLRRYSQEPPSVRLQALAMRGMAFRSLKKHRKALSAFNETVDAFRGLKPTEQENLTLEAISAVAEAHFHIGNDLLRLAKRIKLDSPSDTKMREAITKKMAEMTKAKAIYEQVIAYQHPGWMIAAWTQLGSAYRDLADAVENAAIPRRIRHLPEVVDQWQQDMAERAKVIRQSAIEAYGKALEVAQRERWFNEYSERAEASIAQLDLTDRSVREFRLRPRRLRPNSGYVHLEEVGPCADPIIKETDAAAVLAKRVKDVERALEGCVAAAPDNAKAWYDLGILRERRGDAAGAEQAFRRALAAKPDDPAAAAKVAGADLARGRDDAVATLGDLIQKNRFQPEARNLLAAHALSQDDYQTALKHSRNVLLGDPRNINALLNAAVAYYRQGLYDQAGLIASSALDKQPKAASLSNVMGLVYLQKDDTRRATEAFTTALASDPHNIDARLNLAALELGYGNFASALSRFDEVLTERPDDARVVLSRAVALRGLERYDEAAKGYQRALELKPSYAEAEYNLCVLNHQFTNDWAQAKRYCGSYSDKIDRKHPKYREVKKRLKATEATLKALEAAKAAQDKAAGQPPQQPKSKASAP